VFPSRLEIISGVVDGEPISVEHKSQAVYCIDQDGRMWVRKRELNTGRAAFVSEIVGWLLARQLGAMVPDAAVIMGAGQSWLSRVIPAVKHWATEDLVKIANLDDLGVTLAVDVILVNEDRHPGQILLEPFPDRFTYRAWSIDFGESMIGLPDEFEELLARLPNSHNLADGFPVDMVAGVAQKTAREASLLSESDLRAIATETSYLSGEDGAALLRILKYRCRNAPSLIAAYLKMAGVEP
jgi:hypothetical protein